MQFIFSLFKSFGNHYLIMGAFNLVCALGLLIFGVLNGFHMDVQIYDILFLLTTGLTIIISGRIYRVNLNKPFVAVK